MKKLIYSADMNNMRWHIKGGKYTKAACKKKRDEKYGAVPYRKGTALFVYALFETRS